MTDQTSPQWRTAKRFLLLLLLLATVMLALISKALWAGLLLAVVVAALISPLHLRLTALLRGRKSVSASILIVLILVVLIGPVVGMSAFVVKEGRAGIAFVSGIFKSEGVTGLVDTLPEPLKRVANEVLARLPTDEGGKVSIEDTLQGQGGTAASAATAVGAAMSATFGLLFQLVVMLIALFFFLVEGESLMEWIDGASPLLPGQTRELLTEVRHMSGSVVISSVATALVQALVALIGYFIARVPHPFFFATMTFFTAFIPAVGAGSMCVAAAALLLITGHTGFAIFLAIYGLVVVGLVDNVVKPLLIKGGKVTLNGGVVFFSLIGGLAAFGTVGLLLGPLVVTFFVALIRVYRRDFAPKAAAAPVAAS